MAWNWELYLLINRNISSTIDFIVSDRFNQNSSSARFAKDFRQSYLIWKVLARGKTEQIHIHYDTYAVKLTEIFGKPQEFWLKRSRKEIFIFIIYW